jgi:hypothetical protein
VACVAYGSEEGDPNWNPFADLASPYGIIDITTWSQSHTTFGKTYQ